MWFGANVSGPDAPNLVRNGVVNYSAAWFGWQTENGVGDCRHEEAKLHAQTAAVKAARSGMTTLAYGADVSNVFTFYDRQKAALADPRHKGWFLPSKSDVEGRSGSGSGSGSGSATCGFGSNPAWDFRNASASRYFAEVVLGQWADDPTVDSVFLDEADAIVCTWSGSARDNGLPTIADVYAWS